MDNPTKDKYDKLIQDDIKHISEENSKAEDKAKPDKKAISFFKLQYYNPSNFINSDSSTTKYKNLNPLIIFGCIFSLVTGAALPGFSFLFGQTLNNIRFNKDTDFLDVMTDLSIKYIILGGIIFFTAFLMIFLWNYIGKNLAMTIKSVYFKTILDQEQSYFDSINPHEYSTKVQNQIKLIENGLGQKVGQTIMSLTMCIISLCLGLVISWKLTLVLFSVIPFISAAGIWLGKAMQSIDEKKRKKYEKAGGIAEEVMYNIKTVASFGNFKYEQDRFDECLEESKQAGYQDGLKTAIAMFCIFFFIYGSYGLAVWFGSYLIEWGEKNQLTGKPFGPGDVITVLMSIIFGAFSLGAAAPNIKAIGAACEASTDFFELLERIPQIKNNRKESTLFPSKNSIKGEIEFRNVNFSYNSIKKVEATEKKQSERKNTVEEQLDLSDNSGGSNNANKDDVNKQNDENSSKKTLFQNLNIKISAGAKIAIVGESGSGKSTIVNLLERLYEVDSGQILIDGLDLSKIDLNHWRSMIGYVAQEPVLFNTSIKDNVIFGRENSEFKDEDINIALEKAYAKNFISAYNEGVLYRAGIKGSRLSGGQKQRIAIARAILGNPKILIFDEATSALDNKSERIVKKALNEISATTTTIIIAHRLSTVVNCDRIFVLDKGIIVEEGNHEELLKREGAYYKLVKSQLVEKDEEKNDEVNNNSARKISSVSEEPSIINQIEKEDIVEDDTEKKKLEAKKKQEEEEQLFNDAKKGLTSILKGACLYVVLAFFSAFFCGATSPIHGYLLSDATTHLGILDFNEMKSKSRETAIAYIIFAFLAGGFMFFLMLSFNRIGEYITFILRKRVFRHYLRMHIGYFDSPEHSPGALLTKLSNDTTMINGIAFSMIGSIIQSISTLFCGLAMGFYYSWQLALVCIGFVPLIGISSYFQIRVTHGLKQVDEGSDVEAGSILSESVNNTKTIFSYNFQKKALVMYNDIIDKQREETLKTTLWSGFLYGLSQFFMYGAFSLLYYVGAKLLVNGTLTYDHMNKAIFGVIFGAYGLGNAQMYVGDYAKAKEALVSIFKVLNSKTEIDPFENKEKVSEEETNKIQISDGKTQQRYDEQISENNLIKSGDIEFKNVCFEYPTRKGFTVLKNLSFRITYNQTVAFVGSSGSGKSTIVQLLERFYDPVSGEILVDGKNIKSYDLIQLRRQIGFVMQEPVLFKTTIKDNIHYGKLSADDSEIIEAANKAYISKFFNKNADENNKENNKDFNSKGITGNAAIDNSIISGGEKQRVAIARSIIKNPKIMLFDEATSALDKNSEEIVQKALDEQMKNRTSLVVAHRLSTIVNADKIFVLKSGEIVEEGTHSELLKKKSLYYSLFMSACN